MKMYDLFLSLSLSSIWFCASSTWRKNSRLCCTCWACAANCWRCNAMISTWKEQRFWRFFPFLDKSSAVPLLGPLPPHYRYPVHHLVFVSCYPRCFLKIKKRNCIFDNTKMGQCSWQFLVIVSNCELNLNWWFTCFTYIFWHVH